jgi:WD40 repeat protein
MTCASGSSDFYTRIWNLDGEMVENFLYQNGSITTVKFSDDGQHLASGSADFTVFIRNLTDEETLPIVLNNDNIVRTISFTPDSSQIAIGGDDYGVDIWELFDDEGNYQGYISNTLNHDYTVISAAFLPNGETLVTATWGSLISWWDVPNRETIQTVDRGFLISAGIFDGTPIILSEPSIGTIEVYNAETLQNIIMIEDAHPTTIYQGALSPDRAWLVTASYDGFRIWDMATGEMAYEGLGYTGFVSELKWSDDSKLLGVGLNNGDVVLFTPETLTEEVFDVSNARILAIDFSSDLNIVASGGDDNEINLWRRTDGEIIVTLEGHIDTIYDVAFSPDGNTIATASSDYSVNIWQGVTGDTEDYGQFLSTLEEHEFRVKGVAYSPDGSLIASVSDDGTAMLWDAANGELKATLTGFTGYAKRIGFNQDGTLLFTYDWDGVMRILGIPVE